MHRIQGRTVLAAFIVLSTALFSDAQEEPKDSPSFTRLGIMTIRAGRFEEGIKHLDRAILLDKDNSLAYYWRGRAKASMGNYQEATKDFDATIALDPEEPTAYVERATARRKLKDEDGARADMDRAIKLQPSLADPPKEIAKAPAKPPEPVKKETPPAPKEPAPPAPKNPAPPEPQKDPPSAPQKPEAPELPASFKIIKSKELRLVEKLGKLIDLPPAEILSEQYFNLAMAQWNLGKVNEALGYFEKAVQNDPKNAVFYNKRGEMKAFSEKVMGAKKDMAYVNGVRADYDKAISLNPKYADAYRNRGVLKDLLGDRSGAQADYTQAITINPNFAEAYNKRGLSKQLTGDLRGSLADHNKAIELSDKADPANVWFLYRGRGNTREAMGDLKGAVADWEKAIELHPRVKMELEPKIKQAKAKIR